LWIQRALSRKESKASVFFYPFNVFSILLLEYTEDFFYRFTGFHLKFGILLEKIIKPKKNREIKIN